MAYVPNRGDIVHLQFDPSSGQEMKGPHFGLVVSGAMASPSGQQAQCFLDFFEMVGTERAIAVHQSSSRDSANLVDQQIGIVFELAGFLHSDP